MRNKALFLATRIGIVMLALAALTVGAAAQDSTTPMRLCGLINDYAATKGGPWEIRGTWCLKIHGESSTADFSAAFTMVGVSDVTSPTARNEHTHHMNLVGGTVTASSDGNGFVVSGGSVTITINGNYPPPFEPPASTLTIRVFGGNAVPFSNIQLTLGGGAANHFGSLPINGVVRKAGNHQDEHRDEK